jgi:beta-galactosidase
MWPQALAFGGDYNPEQWPDDIWAEDIALMREAGVSMVTLGVFAWSLLEPEPGRYEFGWLDRVIENLYAAGISVDLATATATPPPWLVTAHPEVKPVTADGVRLEFGSRQGYCPSSPIFRDHVARLTRTMVERYGEHPAVRLWHISNEYGDHITECFCGVSQTHFQRWLAERYGTVDALNDAWGTRHWGQIYGGFDQVPAPRRMPGPGNPGHALDWRRFCSDALLELMLAEKTVLREVAPHVPVTTNFMSMFYALDYWRWAVELDVVTDDAYPDPADPAAHIDAARNYDLMRSLGRGKPWLLLEQAPSAVSWRPVNLPKPPGVMRLWSYQAIARGSDGAMFFQWRAPRFGSELHHSTMLPAAGPDTRVFREIRSLGGEVARLGAVAGSCARADVAILLDWDNWWALDAAESMPSDRMRWRAALDPFYRAVFRAGITADFARPGDDLSAYRLVIAPNSYLLRETDDSSLERYVAAGGRLVVGPFSGVVDEHCRAHPGGAPGPLADLLGVRVEEVWPLLDGDVTPVTLAGNGAASAAIWSEWLRVGDADVVARYAGGPLAGMPAITRRTHGAGAAWYVSFLPKDAEPLLAPVFEESRITVRPFDGVEAVLRTGEDTAYLFLLNHNRVPATVALDYPGTDLITGRPAEGAVDLPPYGVAVVQQHRPATRATNQGDIA